MADDAGVKFTLTATNLSGEAFAQVLASVKKLEQQTKETTERGKEDWRSYFAEIAEGVAAGELLAKGFEKAGELLLELPEKLLELGERGSEVDHVTESFERLSGGTKAADDSLEKMRAGFRGTVSDFDLMSTANLAMSRGLKLTSDQFGEFAAFARLAGQQAPQLGTAREQWERMMTAIATGRERALKGLPLDYGAVSASVDNYAHSLGKTTDQLSFHEKQQATVNAVLEQTKAKLDAAGETETSFAEKVAAARVTLTNWADSLGLAIAKSPAVKVATDAMAAGFQNVFGGDRTQQVTTMIHYIDSFAIGVVKGADYVVTAVDNIGDAFLGLPYIWNTLLGDFNAFEAGLDTGLLKVLSIMRSVPGQSAKELAALDDVINKVQSDQLAAGIAAGEYEKKATANRAAVFDWTVTMAGAHKTLGELQVKMEAASKAADGHTVKLGAATTATGDFGDSNGKATDKVIKLQQSLTELTNRIEAAAKRGLSASQILELFGKDAIKASEDAQKAGVKSSAAIEAVATGAVEMKAAFAGAADGAAKMWEAIANDPASKQALAYEQRTIDLITQVQKADQDWTISHADGVQQRILQIRQEEQAQIDAVNKMGDVDADYKRERIAQIHQVAQEQIDAAHGMYDTIGALEKASGAQSTATLREQAKQAQLLYEQMRDSGQFSAQDVQKAWEDSVKAQGKAVGGLKGDILTMYADLPGKLSATLADMATHWRSWKDDLKKLWSDIAGDFASMLAKMLKQWIEGFLMKMLGSLIGSRGSFASAFASLLPMPGGGGFGFGGAGILNLAGHAGGGAGGGIFGGGPNVFGGGGGIPWGQLLGGGALAAGGLYSLFTAQGRGQNILGGAETGAGIGTMILPGIGTAIGAGFGALAGLIKSFFHFGPSKEELAGRGVVADFQQSTFAGLSDAQRGEANQAVASGAWKDASAAGLLIAVRDAYISIGKTSQQAQDDVKAFWDAEKKGPEATTAAMQPLLDALDQQKQKQQAAGDASQTATDQQLQDLDQVGAAIDALPDGLGDVKTKLVEAFQSAAGAIQRGPLGDIRGQIQTLGSAGALAASQIETSFSRLDINIPVKWDVPDTTQFGPDYPGHASGGLFTRAHIARIAEGGKPEIVGDQDFMTRALVGAVKTVSGQSSGVAAGGGAIVHNHYWNISGISLRDVVEREIVPIMTDIYRHDTRKARSEHKAAWGLS